MKNPMKGFIRDTSLKWKMILMYTALVVVIVAVTGLITYDICVNQIEESEKKLLLQNLKQTMGFIDFNLGMYMKKSDIIFSNTIIQSVLSKEYTDDENYEVYLTYQDTIYKIIEPVMQDIIYPDLSLKSISAGLSADKVKIVIYIDNPSMPKDGSMISGYEDVKNEDWVKNTRSNSKGIYWRGLFKVKNVTDSNDMEYISMNRVMKNFKNRKEMGILSIMIPENQLRNIITRNSDNPEISLFLADNSGNAVISVTKNTNISQADVAQLMKHKAVSTAGMESIHIGQQDFMYSYAVSEITGWRLIGLYPYKAITERGQSIQYAVLIVLLLGILLSIAITVFIAYIITRRLNKITRKMSRIKEDRYAFLEEVVGNDEIGQLDKSFNDMVRSLNELVERENRLVMQRNSLQVELLQLQINPHILYNTLATIGWSVKKAGQDNVYDVIENLIRFFKYFLNKGNLITDLRHELDMITKYIEILRFTYQLDCRVVIDIEEDVYMYSSLNLILQPVVENAMIHGIKPSGKPGLLEIEGRVYGKEIYFKIRDNGLGMEAEKAEALECGTLSNESGGYGISNVIKRIRLYYDVAFGLKVQSVPGEGTTVILKIPAYTHEELDAKIRNEF